MCVSAVSFFSYLHSIAGTHDLSLLMKTLQNATSATHGTQLTVPQYDKSLRNGRGDRVPPEKWMVINGE